DDYGTIVREPVGLRSSRPSPSGAPAKPPEPESPSSPVKELENRPTPVSGKDAREAIESTGRNVMDAEFRSEKSTQDKADGKGWKNTSADLRPVSETASARVVGAKRVDKTAPASTTTL